MEEILAKSEGIKGYDFIRLFLGSKTLSKWPETPKQGGEGDPRLISSF